MAAKTEAYVDTSAFIAFADRSDTYHPLFHRLFADPPKLVTTTLVVAEGHGWFLRRYDRFRALQFLGIFEAMESLKVMTITERDQEAAFAVLRRYSDQNLTLTDAAGLHMMESRKIQSCWSTDFHLGLSGVPLVIHGH
jgi:predicted nucleic acid-binding protein